MNDTMQTMIRSVLKIGAGVLVSKGWMDDSTSEIIIAGILAALGVAWGYYHRTPKVPVILLAGCLALGVTGCANVHSTTKKTTFDPATGITVVEESDARLNTVFDGNSAVTKFKNSPASVVSSNGFVMPAGTSIGSLTESSQSPSIGTVLGDFMKAYQGK